MSNLSSSASSVTSVLLVVLAACGGVVETSVGAAAGGAATNGPATAGALGSAPAGGTSTSGTSVAVDPNTPVSTALPETVVTLSTAAKEPVGLVVDASSVYFIDFGDGPSGALFKTPIGGGPTQPLITALNSPAGLALSGQNLYISPASAPLPLGSPRHLRRDSDSPRLQRQIHRGFDGRCHGEHAAGNVGHRSIAPALALLRDSVPQSREGRTRLLAMRPLSYVLCDVFTDRPLTGNALAVFTDATELSGAQMQALAREMNLSESSFVVPPSADADAGVRIFTPTMELPFGVTPASASANVKKLVDAGILREVTGRKRDQRFVASEIIHVAHSD